MIRKAAATAQLFGHALSRIATEFNDLGREQRGEQREFDAVVFMCELPSQQWAAFKSTVLGKQGISEDGNDPRLSGPTFGVPPRSQAFYVKLLAPTGDAAAMRVATIVRDALRDVGATTDRFRVEAEPAEGGEKP